MRATIAIVLAVISSPTLAAECRSMSNELSGMVAVDQALRKHAIREMQPSARAPSRIEEQVAIVDQANTKTLRRLLGKCGWPKKSVHGVKATHDAWMLVQHADRDPKFQSQAIKLLETAVKQGEASGVQLAYLSDRVATSQQKPQLYGTQFNVMGECGLELMPVDDLEKVEERRKSLGMPSLSEYRKQILDHAMPPKCAQGAK